MDEYLRGDLEAFGSRLPRTAGQRHRRARLVTPIHYYGLGSAIYIREAAVFDVAATILNRLEPHQQEDEVNAAATSRAAMSVLYLHEAFHHKIESLAIRYEIVERTRRYVPYSDDVMTPLLRAGSDDVLEEALATAEMYRRFKNEKVYYRGLPKIVANATREMLIDWFPTLPPSYRQSSKYLGDGTFQDALKLLMSQVHEATTTPSRRSSEWALAPHLHRGLFDCQRITHVVVPTGERPRLPWIGHTPALVSVSTRKAVKGLEKYGWRKVDDRGSGSHIWMEREGWPPVTLTANRESLSPVVLKNIAQALGVKLKDLRF